MDKKDKLKKVISFSKTLGLKFVKKTNKPVEYEYNDGVCYLQVNSGELNDVDFVLHNLAHFMIASPERRYKPDFGLGSSPDSPDQSLIPIIDAFEANKEENLCVMVSDYLAQHLFSEKLNPLGYSLVQEKENYLEYLGLFKEKKLQLKLREISDSEFLKWKKTSV